MENKTHLALYRKWRPQSFDRVWGQEHITSVLKYEIENNKISHAYLFCGSRGTGKTTCAKIFAKAVNCHAPQEGNPCGVCVSCRAIDSGTAVDVLEMDAASNNGVDNIRDIRDEVAYTPSELKYRVYIIDEVHMLSGSAFNALLKTLEEPPEHVIFILATTELHKLPATIISRCQRFDFRRLTVSAIVGCMDFIAHGEGIELDADAARMIARLAQGGMRDAISLLELCAGSGRGRVTAETVNSAVGITGREQVVRIVEAIARADYDLILSIVADIYSSSRDIAVFWQDLISYYRDMLISKTIPDSSGYLDLTDDERQKLSAIASLFSKETILAHIKLLEDALVSMQRSTAIKRTIAELALIRLSDGCLDTSNEALLARISRLEDLLQGAGAVRPKRKIPDESYQNEDVGKFACGADAPQSIGNKKNSRAYASDKTGDVMADNIDKSNETQNSKADPVNANDLEATKTNGQSEEPAATMNGKAREQNKEILRPIRSWVDIVERISRTSNSTGALLTGSKAYISQSDGRIVILFENSFSIFMLERGNAKEIIRSVLSGELGRELGERDVLFEEAPAKKNAGDDDRIFDEIENNN